MSLLDRLKAAQLHEPARLRAVAVAVVGLLFAVGLVSSTELPAWFDAALALFVILAPLAQGESTRKVVTPTATATLPEVTAEPVANGPVWVDPVQNVSQSSDPVELS